MEKLSISKRETIKDTEYDIEKIRRQFMEAQSDQIELLASHLARPEGFARTLITGAIASSEELRKKIGYDFTRTHRGSYMYFPPKKYSEGGHNDDISFSAGKVQRLYQESSILKREKDWRGGLGFIIPAKSLLSLYNAFPTWGGFDIQKSLETVKEKQRFESSFKKFDSLSREESYQLSVKPPKEDFLTLVNIARKGEALSGGDQAEVNLKRTGNGKYPRLSIKETIALIPEKSRDAFLRYLDSQIKSMQPFSKKIKTEFGVDIAYLTAETILQQFQNIYWYPQENIGNAVEYLTVHPEIIRRFLVSKDVANK